jgi:hypothetical protein
MRQAVRAQAEKKVKLSSTVVLFAAPESLKGAIDRDAPILHRPLEVP